MTKPAPPMIGRVFGKLTVLGEAGRNERGQKRFDCRCVCGLVVVRIGAALRFAVARGTEPNCGCSKRPPGSIAVKATPAAIARGKVTTANYRSVAAGFDEGEVARLAVILRRHPKAECHNCSKGFGCHLAAEAVEIVLLERGLGSDAKRGSNSDWQVDYTRQGMYV